MHYLRHPPPELSSFTGELVFCPESAKASSLTLCPRVLREWWCPLPSSCFISECPWHSHIMRLEFTAYIYMEWWVSAAGLNWKCKLIMGWDDEYIWLTSRLVQNWSVQDTHRNIFSTLFCYSWKKNTIIWLQAQIAGWQRLSHDWKAIDLLLIAEKVTISLVFFSHYWPQTLCWNAS